jgi:hypothetical protein
VIGEYERAFYGEHTPQRSAVGEGFRAAWVCHVLSQIQRAPGRLDAVVRTCRRTLEITAPPGRPAVPAAGAACVGLVIALDTVKKHVSHVLGKLGAANRTEAVARARELGLIP